MSPRKSPPPSVCDGARRLREWRLVRGVSQARLTELLDVHRRTPHEWEWGAKIPSLMSAVRIDALTEGEVPVEAWGYTESDVAPLIAFGLRRARKAGTIPSLPTAPTRGAIILAGPSSIRP